LADSKIIELWLQNQPRPATQDCYRRNAEPLLITEGVTPISRACTIAAMKSLFGFCQASSLSIRRPKCRCHATSTHLANEKAVQRIQGGRGTESYPVAEAIKFFCFLSTISRSETPAIESLCAHDESRREIMTKPSLTAITEKLHTSDGLAAFVQQSPDPSAFERSRWRGRRFA
jgi:hypothetical protein